jgi:MFS family permease
MGGGRVAASCGVLVYLAVAFVALGMLYRAPSGKAQTSAAASMWPERRVVLSVVAAGVIYGLWNASLVAVIGFGPLMLTERGWTIAAASSTTSLVLWLIALSLPAGGYLSDLTGRNSAVLLGGLILFAGALVLAAHADNVVAPFILLGIVAGLPCGPMMGLPSRVLAPQTRAVGMGVFFSVYYFLQVVCPWCLGRLSEWVASSRVALDAATFFLLGAMLMWLVFRRLSRDARSATEPEASFAKSAVPSAKSP